MREQGTKAFVLLSGGIDSSTVLHMAIQDWGQDNVIGLSIHYGQRHHKEIGCARQVAEYAGVKHKIAEMAQQPPSMLTDESVDIPDVSYEELPEGISPTYVPFRNGQLLSYVSAIAQASDGGAIYFGAHAEDAQNWAYPDCTPEFIGAMANAIYIGTYGQIRLHAPIMWMVKHEIIAVGQALHVPWSLTWSCYKGGSLQCGTCPTCRSRREGFTKAGVIDPTTYETDITSSQTTPSEK